MISDKQTDRKNLKIRYLHIDECFIESKQIFFFLLDNKNVA
jgi:hypothetical protein